MWEYFCSAHVCRKAIPAFECHLIVFVARYPPPETAVYAQPYASNHNAILQEYQQLRLLQALALQKPAGQM